MPKIVYTDEFKRDAVALVASASIRRAGLVNVVRKEAECSERWIEVLGRGTPPVCPAFPRGVVPRRGREWGQEGA